LEDFKKKHRGGYPINRLFLESVKANNNIIEVDFSCTGRMKKFFVENKFIAEYNVSVEAAPRSIQVIPFLATACPIVWADNAELIIEECDETFLKSLEVIKIVLQKFYPRMNFGGRISAKKIIKTPISDFTRCMSLFSGGIDSLATLIRHHTENPILFTIFGQGFTPDSVIEISKNIAETFGLELRTVRNNPYSILDLPMLSTYRQKIGGDWYRRVMHGLALIGLCAPVSYVEKAGTIFIASSATKDFKRFLGSHPEIDNNVRWAGTRSFHDAYDLTRQQKMFLIADFLKDKNWHFRIRTCNYPNLPNNCSRCEKCSRTIVGLQLAGINPNQYGYYVQKDTAALIKENLLRGNWNFDEAEKWEWEDIQHYAGRRVNSQNSEMRAFLNWLLSFDIKASKSRTISKKSRFKSALWHIGIPFLRLWPYAVHLMFRKLYKRFRQQMHI